MSSALFYVRRVVLEFGENFGRLVSSADPAAEAQAAGRGRAGAAARGASCGCASSLFFCCRLFFRLEEDGNLVLGCVRREDLYGRGAGGVDRLSVDELFGDRLVAKEASDRDGSDDERCQERDEG